MRGFDHHMTSQMFTKLKMDALKAFKYKMFLKRKKNDEELEKEILNHKRRKVEAEEEEMLTVSSYITAAAILLENEKVRKHRDRDKKRDI